MIGIVGHLSLVVAFVASLAALVSFALASRSAGRAPRRGRTVGRWSWAAQGAGVAVASAMLWAALFGYRFEYSYVYQQTSTAMPFRYQFSAFWAGQEGSLLCVGHHDRRRRRRILVRWSAQDRRRPRPCTSRAASSGAPVLAVVALCQAFIAVDDRRP